MLYLLHYLRSCLLFCHTSPWTCATSHARIIENINTTSSCLLYTSNQNYLSLCALYFCSFSNATPIYILYNSIMPVMNIIKYPYVFIICIAPPCVFNMHLVESLYFNGDSVSSCLWHNDSNFDLIYTFFIGMLTKIKILCIL